MDRICSVDGCGRKHRAKGLCSRHWQRQADGLPLDPLLRPGRPAKYASREDLANQFWEKVDKSGDCWLWTGPKTRGGYGRIKVQNNGVLVHRLAWELIVGPLSNEEVIDHLCHVRSCVNPSHLRATDHMHNMQNREGAASHSRSGIRGVTWDSDRKSWRGRVTANKVTHRKRFSNMSDAEEWVIRKRIELHH